MGYRTASRRFYEGARSLIAPGLRHSQRSYGEVLERQVRPGERWLELGCGHHVLPPWQTEHERRLVEKASAVVGIDADWGSLLKHKTIRMRVRGGIDRLPFGNGRFSLATANMVVEHLSDPVAQFREIARVLEPGGRLLLHTPSVYGYALALGRLVPETIKPALIRFLEARREEDVFPTYYRANSRRALRGIAREAGFIEPEFVMVASSPVSIMIPPLVVPELVLIRLLMLPALEGLRTNIVAILAKSKAGA